MRRTVKILAIAVGSLLAVSALAACADENNNPDGSAEKLFARICYDNLENDGIDIAEADTKISIPGATEIKALGTDNFGNPIKNTDTIATYSDGVFTAKGTGTLVFKVNGEEGRLEVVPAYVTDPGYQYGQKAGGISDDLDLNNSSLLGNTHDPSFIETVDSYGYPVYYLFSTGWGTGNDIHKSTDLLTWTYEGKATHDSAELPAEIAAWENAEKYSDIDWWAPDIVPAYGGGYWLYTCLVSHDNPSLAPSAAESAWTPNDVYSMASIVLYYTDSLDKNWKDEGVNFEYKGVLMQSVIPQRTLQKEMSGEIDVNSIDPQIIYTPDGKMYMAYGSFGTGNWMLELNPETGLRKDDVYADNHFKDWKYVRRQRNKVVSGDEETFNGNKYSTDFLAGNAVTSEYYGTLISLGAMEAPVIARHDNVKITDESGTELEGSGKTYYYSMHSYNWLAQNYQMWGGRSESVWGTYKSVSGGVVRNENVGNPSNQGNKYMGAFCWRDASKSANNKEINIVLPGHNDLYTTKDGVSLAAYITRTFDAHNERFCVQLHQYYLNSYGDICISPNRYGGEIDRAVSQEELFAYTDKGRFEMVVLANVEDAHIRNAGATNSALNSYAITSYEVKLETDGKITKDSVQIGEWKMYGRGYIKLTFTETLKGATNDVDSEETVYYGVVRPAWLGNRNQSGFTITAMGHTEGTDKKTNMGLFLNNYSTITGSDFVGD